jgi:hypothetical protein
VEFKKEREPPVDEYFWRATPWSQNHIQLLVPISYLLLKTWQVELGKRDFPYYLVSLSSSIN